MTTCEHGFHHAFNGDATAMVLLAEWAQGVITLRPDPVLLSGVSLIYKVHLVFGMTGLPALPFIVNKSFLTDGMIERLALDHEEIDEHWVRLNEVLRVPNKCQSCVLLRE